MALRPLHHSQTLFAAGLACALASLMPGCGQAESDRNADSSTTTRTGNQTQQAEQLHEDASKPDVTPAEDGMVWIPAGSFIMGSDKGPRDQRPAREVRMDGYWMDATPITNAEFKKFVDATGYITAAEKPIPRSELPKEIRNQVPEENLTPRSMVFSPPNQQVPLHNELAWWDLVEGANWKHPYGPESSIEDKMDHPVVHVNWHDARAYAKWAGRSLPTEAQFEYAARGGLEQKDYVWGDEQVPDGKWPANIFQGQFPVTNDLDDGYATTNPVKSFPANGFGLYDMSGNVWEWCHDWYDRGYYKTAPNANPPGPPRYFDNGPRAMDGTDKRVTRGGSYLCSDVYCLGYMPMTRMMSDPFTPHAHTGFRTVDNKADPPEDKPKAVDPLPNEGDRE